MGDLGARRNGSTVCYAPHYSEHGLDSFHSTFHNFVMDALPIELLCTVVDHCVSSQLKTLSVVSHRIRTAASRKLFRRVLLESGADASQFLAWIAQNPQLGRHVEFLTFCNLPVDASCIQPAFDAMRNVESLDVWTFGGRGGDAALLIDAVCSLPKLQSLGCEYVDIEERLWTRLPVVRYFEYRGFIAGLEPTGLQGYLDRSKKTLERLELPSYYHTGLPGELRLSADAWAQLKSLVVDEMSLAGFTSSVFPALERIEAQGLWENEVLLDPNVLPTLKWLRHSACYGRRLDWPPSTPVPTGGLQKRQLQHMTLIIDDNDQSNDYTDHVNLADYMMSFQHPNLTSVAFEVLVYPDFVDEVIEEMSSMLEKVDGLAVLSFKFVRGPVSDYLVVRPDIHCRPLVRNYLMLPSSWIRFSMTLQRQTGFQGSNRSSLHVVQSTRNRWETTWIAYSWRHSQGCWNARHP